MNNTEIIYRNEQIAIFLGAEKITKGNAGKYETLFYDPMWKFPFYMAQGILNSGHIYSSEGLFYSSEGLLFHKSWQWLMEAIEKIESVKVSIIIRREEIKIMENGYIRLLLTSQEQPKYINMVWWAISEYCKLKNVNLWHDNV